MLKKLINCIFIFIYILLTGCDTLTGPEETSYYLELDAPFLEMNQDGYYIMEIGEGNIMRYTTLKAETGSTDEVQLLTWEANQEFGVEHQGQIIWENLVNSSSYTDGSGNGFTVLGVWQEFVGDTIIVYCGFEDINNNYYEDIIKVVVE
tara:strand:- start:4874 stop:5320 length:447 start_codon:yes stop_codon:yes gene_type:complete